MVSAALAAAHTAQKGVISVESNITLDQKPAASLQRPSGISEEPASSKANDQAASAQRSTSQVAQTDPGPLKPEGMGHQPVSTPPGGAAWIAPQSPALASAWDSTAVNFARVITITSNQYLMWYDGRGPNGWAMGLAQSNDGKSWTKYSTNPVLKPGASGQWDDTYRGQAAFLYDGGLFKMWYAGGPASGSWQTGYATSTNGIDWSVYGGNPVLLSGAPGSWDEAESDGPTVIKDGGTYKMWYYGCVPDYSSCSIGYATSPNGKAWTKYSGNPVITGSGGGETSLAWPSVVKNGGTYMMWFTEFDNKFNFTGIGLATSTDGITWTKNPNNPILKTGWDNAPANSQFVVQDGTGYKMWLRSGNGATKGIGYATSPDGIAWTMYSGDPLLLPGPVGLTIYVNYAHDWVYAHTLANVPITVTVGSYQQTGTTDVNGDFRGWEWPWNDPKGPDIQPGDAVSATAGGLTTEVNPVGTINGKLNMNTAVISGTIQAPFGTQGLDVRCELWGPNNPPPPINLKDVSAAGGKYACDFGAEGWTMQPGQTIAVFYFEPDGDAVLNVFEPPWMRVNYRDDWAGGDYPAGHTMWITVTNSTGDLKATTQAVSSSHGGWSGDGFDTKNPWSPSQPDLQPGDRVYFASDDGFQDVVQIGVITGTVDADKDLVSGRIYANWLPSPLSVECDPWGSPNPAPNKSSSAGANGDPPYSCQWDPSTEWYIQPGQDVGVMYIQPNGDRVINVFQQPDLNLHLRVNYSHDWVESNYEAGHTVWITLTQSDGVSVLATAHGQTGTIPWWGGGQTGFSTNYNVPWDGGIQPDIQTGEWVYGRVDNGFTTAVRVGEISGAIDPVDNSISGTVNASWYTQTLYVECQPWGAPSNTPTKNSTAGLNGNPPYYCQWNPKTEWQIQYKQDLAVVYFTPDGNQLIHVFQLPDPNLHLNVNYGQDWVEGNYVPGHTIWLTMTQSDKTTVVATAHGQTGTIPWWGGDQTGFSTNYNVPWDSGSQPDIQAGDWVFGRLDNGYGTAVHLGLISGVIDQKDNSISGAIDTPWFTQTLNIDCLPWGGPKNAPNKNSTAGPTGNPTYYCKWDPGTEWKILAGQDVGVAYNGTDGNWVANVFRLPAPHLGIGTWADGNPGSGGNFVFNMQYWNDGQAPAENTVITETLLGGLTYLSDSSGLPHTGSGSPGDPLVFQVGTLPNSSNNSQFQVFVNVTALASNTITNSVQIETSTPYSQGDPGNKQSQWSGHVEPGNTDLSVGINPWTWDPVPGYDFIYNLNVCNKGSTGSTQVTLTDTLPLSTTMVDWKPENPGWSLVSSKPHQGVYSRPAIPGNWCGAVDVRVHLDASAWLKMPLTNNATISASNDQDPNDNQASITTYVGSPHYNLNVSKGWFWGRLVPGGDLYYQFNFNNFGNIPADAVSVTSTLPAHTTFIEAWANDNFGQRTITPTTVVQGKYVVWGPGLLINGVGSNLTIHLGIDGDTAPGQVLTHQVAITRLPVEDDFDDNAITWVDTLNSPGPNLRVDKQNYSWWDDHTLSYEVRFYNLGSTTIQNFTITDTYPVSTTFNGSWDVNYKWPYTFTVDAANHRLIFQGSQLDPSNSFSLNYRVNLDPSIVGVKGLTLTNHVDALLAGDVYPADNHDQVTALTGPDLWVKKTLSSGKLLPGELITYELKFGNNQSSSAGWWNMQGSAWLTDTLPAGVIFQSAQRRYCGAVNWCDASPTQNGNILTWQLGSIGPGEHNEIRVTVRVPYNLTGTLLNQVNIASDQPGTDIEPAYANNHDSLSVLISKRKIYLPVTRK